MQSIFKCIVGCPNGWIPFRKHCYRWFNSYENWEASNAICKDHSSVMAPAEDSDEFDFLIKLR